MATITSGLTLSGSGTTSDILNIRQVTSLMVASPAVQTGTLNLTTTFATSISDLNGSTNTADTFLYLLNASAGLETIHLQNVATTSGTGSGTETCVLAQGRGLRLEKGEFAFLPLEALSHVQFKGSTVTAKMEYGFWTRSVTV